MDDDNINDNNDNDIVDDNVINNDINANSDDHWHFRFSQCVFFNRK